MKCPVVAAFHLVEMLSAWMDPVKNATHIGFLEGPSDKYISRTISKDKLILNFFALFPLRLSRFTSYPLSST